LGLPDQANWPSSNKIKHVVILCQENRSFDHYFGAFASMFGSGNAIAEAPPLLAVPGAEAPSASGRTRNPRRRESS
jgi:phospholipase C